MDIKAKQVDVIPMIHYYIDEIGLHQIFENYIPNDNGADIRPAQVLCTIITNILIASKPLYKIEEWLTDYMDGHAEDQSIAKKYNDDRCARVIDQLFNADRNSIMTETVAATIKVHELETSHVHNDSTTITFSGAYEQQSKDAVQLEYGYNKDHRPDHKQIVFGLNITEDGHVPISYQLYDGSTADVVTHQTNWDSLRTFLEKEDFIYTADCKLSSRENLKHIDSRNGTFITLVPKNAKDAKTYIERLKEGEIPFWSFAYSVPNSRKKNMETIYRTIDTETSKDGYRIIWVHSNSKSDQDKATRERQLTTAEEKLKELSGKINKYYLKTQKQIESTIKKIISTTGELLIVELTEEEIVEKKQLKRGRSGTDTQFKEIKTIKYHMNWHRNERNIERESKADGVFPLITNEVQLSAAEILKIYKQQPFLEKRFQTKKSILEVAPVFLKKNERIEAITFLYFIALMIVSLIERNIRQQMKELEIESLPILPTGLKCKSPTWNNIRYFFRSIYLAIIVDGASVINEKVKGITELHKKLLRLLKVPISKYTNLTDYWWEFKFQT